MRFHVSVEVAVRRDGHDIRERVPGTLDTQHAMSSYGLPVLLIRGQPYGPADLVPTAGGRAGPIVRLDSADSAALGAAEAAGYPVAAS